MTGYNVVFRVWVDQEEHWVYILAFASHREALAAIDRLAPDLGVENLEIEVRVSSPCLPE